MSKVSRIGAYDIVAKLGSGGMADVYLGTKTGAAGFSRPVVVKRIRDSLRGKTDVQQMFIDEARLSSRIQHPNVVGVEELGEEDGCFFMVMEYVHGVELAALLRDLAQIRRQLTPDAAVAIACAVADGLHAAHEARDAQGRALGVVHRDVSPQNIILSANGGVKVIDFGVAKAAYRLHRTEGHKIKGKLRYMSPEQINGEVDRRSDLFALGVVLWECLTNRRLFSESDDMVVLKRIQEGDIPPPSQFAKTTRELDSVVMQTLAVNPDIRPPTGRKLRQMLQRAVPSAQEFDDAACAALLMATLGGELEDQARRLMVPVQMALNTQELTTEPAQALQRFTMEWVEAPRHVVSTPNVFMEPVAQESARPMNAPASAPKRPSHWLIGAIAGLAVFLGIAGAGLFFMAREEPAESASDAVTVIAPPAQPLAQPVQADPTPQPAADPSEPVEPIEETNNEADAGTEAEPRRSSRRTPRNRMRENPAASTAEPSSSAGDSDMSDDRGFRLIETEDPFQDEF